MPSVIVRFLRRRDAPMISTTSFHGGYCSHRLKKLEKWNRRGLLGVSFCKFGFTAGLMEQEEMTCLHFSDLLTVSGSEWQQQVMCGRDQRVWNFRSLVFSLKITTFFSNFLSIHRSSTQESRISFSASPSPSPYLSLNLAFLFLSFVSQSFSVIGEIINNDNLCIGGRRIGVTSLPPLGCFPASNTLFGSRSSQCVARLNRDAFSFNRKLSSAAHRLIKRLPGIKIVAFEIYKPLLDLIHKPSDSVQENIGKLATLHLIKQQFRLYTRSSIWDILPPIGRSHVVKKRASKVGSKVGKK